MSLRKSMSVSVLINMVEVTNWKKKASTSSNSNHGICHLDIHEPMQMAVTLSMEWK